MSISLTTPLKKSKERLTIFFAGMALFSMFFGAGNIVFPLLLGQISGTYVPFSILGLGLSAVIFPFLGLIAMILYGADLSLFLKRLGKWPSFALLLILQLSQGPVCCLPRLITLMHASIKPYLPEASLLLFSIFICAALFFFTFRPQKIVDLLGVILTPFLLISLGFLIFLGVLNAPPAPQVFEGAKYYFLQGVQGGYQTMDLISSLLFATLILPHLSQGLSSFSALEAKQIVQRRMRGASIIAASLLMLTYIGLCWISAHHSFPASHTIAPEDLLQAIAAKILGSTGGIVAALAVFLACLTTAISLTSVFSEYMREHLFRKKISAAVSLSLTLFITASFANLGFSGIARFMGPILEVLYPILLCLWNIGTSMYTRRRQLQNSPPPKFRL